VTWGIEGGLPSLPHGVWLNDRFLGAVFSNVPLQTGDSFTRPSAGGGGFGDPLERDPAAVREDVIDGYVTIERAARDYGVVVRAVDPELDGYEIDSEATARLREETRGARRGWLEEDAEDVARRYREGELDTLDLVRRYGVILDWGTGQLLARTTEQFRRMLHRRAAAHWA
jgi:N-methylhydantoinase B